VHPPRHPAQRPGRRRLPAGPVGVAVAALLLVVLVVAVDLVNSAADRAVAKVEPGVTGVLPGLVMSGCGAVVLARRPRHGVGLVLAATGLFWLVDSLCGAWAAFGAADAIPPAGGRFAYWVLERVGSLLLAGLPLLLLLYPDGRLPRGRMRGYAAAVLVAVLSLPVVLIVAPAEAVYPPGYPVFEAYRAYAPLSVPLPVDVATALLVITRLVSFSALVAAVVGVALRYRGSDEEDRRRLRWLLWAGALCVLTVVLGLLLRGSWVPTAGLTVAVAVTSVSATIGVLRPDLADIDGLVAATVTWAGVAAVVLAVDAAVVALTTRWLGDRLDTQQLVVLVLLVAVVLYTPVRQGVGVLVRRLLFGRRGDRYEVVSALAARLEEAGEVEDQLPALAAAVAATFKLRFVRVEVLQAHGDRLTASFGTPPQRTRELPISYRGELIGRLLLPASGVRALLSGRDQALLVDVTRQAAVAVRTSRLAAELQQSREGLVLAREDDRRRIRRNLHDGLGPALGGVALRLDAAGNAVRSDPARAEQLLTQARTEVREALADVRRLVHDLRPPALDDLGLRGALEQQADRARSAPLRVDLALADLPSLPAAVEVAAYRIASEALTNVVRHAGASTVVIEVAAESGQLRVEVTDDGVGIAADVVAGVGLRSIRERVSELGGRCEVSCPPGGGTRVRAWLPLGDPTSPPTTPPTTSSAAASPRVPSEAVR
jgi:signal transduction histidine kinase